MKDGFEFEKKCLRFAAQYFVYTVNALLFLSLQLFYIDYTSLKISPIFKGQFQINTSICLVVNKSHARIYNCCCKRAERQCETGKGKVIFI